MKGSLHTDEIMGPLSLQRLGLEHRAGSPCLCHGRRHIPEDVHHDRCGGEHIPELEDKRDIVQNASTWPAALGSRRQGGHPLRRRGDQLQDSLDARCSGPVQDGRPSQITGGILDGPLPSITPSVRRLPRSRDHLARQRGRGYPARPGPGVGQHALQAADLPGRRRRGRHCARDEIPVVLTSRADSIRTRLTSAAVMALVARARRAGKYDVR